MGVISDTTRKIKVFGLVAIIVVGGLYAYTKWDTSNDKSATIIVTLHLVDKRTTRGDVTSYINEAERSSYEITEENPEYSDTFWVRPGEKVRLRSWLHLGKSGMTCTILFDGKVAAGPKAISPDFEASCDISATA